MPSFEKRGADDKTPRLVSSDSVARRRKAMEVRNEAHIRGSKLQVNEAGFTDQRRDCGRSILKREVRILTNLRGR